MPTDNATRTVDLAAPYDEVMATIRDVESQAEWIPEILEAELLEVYEDNDLPATARFKAAATVGTDEYTLSYDHPDDGMSWTMVKGRLQTGQEGRYSRRGDRPEAHPGHLRPHHPPQPAAARLHPEPGDQGARGQHPQRPEGAARVLSPVAVAEWIRGGAPSGRP